MAKVLMGMVVAVAGFLVGGPDVERVVGMMGPDGKVVKVLMVFKANGNVELVKKV